MIMTGNLKRLGRILVKDLPYRKNLLIKTMYLGHHAKELEQIADSQPQRSPCLYKKQSVFNPRGYEERGQEYI
jgi:hypothetical protein